MLTRPRVISAFIVLLLVQLVVAHSLNLFPRLILFDFYQYWGVSVAYRMKGAALGNPYADYGRYHAALSEYATASGDPRLTALHRMSARPGFTATPFLYMLLGALPADYSRAATLFHVLQVLLFVAAVILLGVLCRYPLFPVLCLALVLVLASGPVSSDLRVGNLGCFQFAALTGLLALTVRLRRSPHVALGAAVLTGLTLLVIAKPNVAPAVAAMALSVWWALGIRFAAIAAIPAALAAVLALLISSSYFGSWTVWLAWYRVVFGHNPYSLVRPAVGGNYASSRLLSSWLHLDVWLVVALTSAVLALSLIAVVAWAANGSGRDRARLVMSALGRAFDDPRLAAAIGVTICIALPPLFWYHYYVIAIIPGLWLLNSGAGPSSLALWGFAALALSSGVLNVLFLPLGWTAAVQASAALSWIPLWGGILHRLHSSERVPVAAAPVPPITAAEAPAPARGRGGRKLKARARP
jgi:hypothetical protein